MVHSIMLRSERKSDFVMFWIQICSALCRIQSRVLPVLCVGKCV